MTKVYLDGKWLNAEKTGISIDNRSFRYGDGFFETIKCINHKLPLWGFHSTRLFATLDKMQFEKPSWLAPDMLKDSILELVKQNQHGKLARVRLTIFRGEGGIYDPINHRPHILIQSWPLNPENNKLNENGLVIGEYSGGFKAADSFANLKSNNYLLYAMAALQAKAQHWNDALICNHRGSFADATIANLWVIKNGQIYTPPLSDGPVAGTMRMFLLENLAASGLPVAERTLVKSDLLEADEVFLSNAIYGIKWVRQFEDHEYVSEITANIHAKVIAPLWAATK
jgi:branched-subunit amino acid aminotransferase/4-amino-4-deoxychorismate lyase